MGMEKVFKVAIQLWPITLIAMFIFIVLIFFAVVNFIKAHQAYREGDKKEKRDLGFTLSGIACGILIFYIIFTGVVNSCPNCSQLFSNDQNHCDGCGKQLSYVCSCGKTNSFYTAYCSNCGAEVKE